MNEFIEDTVGGKPVKVPREVYEEVSRRMAIAMRDLNEQLVAYVLTPKPLSYPPTFRSVRCNRCNGYVICRCSP